MSGGPMRRRLLVSTLSALCLGVTAAVVGLTGATPASASSTQQMFMTMYGWYDNTPPGGEIAYPKLHKTAGGGGRFADPIAFATSPAEIPAGKKIWGPRVRKYFIMEDDCTECRQDWSGQGP